MKAYITPRVAVVQIGTSCIFLSGSTATMEIDKDKTIDNNEALGKQHDLWDNDQYPKGFDPWE